jgi:hypothetical protein
VHFTTLTFNDAWLVAVQRRQPVPSAAPLGRWWLCADRCRVSDIRSFTPFTSIGPAAADAILAVCSLGSALVSRRTALSGSVADHQAQLDLLNASQPFMSGATRD